MTFRDAKNINFHDSLKSIHSKKPQRLKNNILHNIIIILTLQVIAATFLKCHSHFTRRRNLTCFTRINSRQPRMVRRSGVYIIPEINFHEFPGLNQNYQIP